MNKKISQKKTNNPNRYCIPTRPKEPDNLNTLSNKYKINKNKFIILVKDDDYNPDNLINKENKIDLKCPICLNILNNPKSCSSNKTSHSFCKKCIDKYLKDNNNCPICKKKFDYKINYKIEKQLIDTLFKCNYFKKGCKKVLNYYNYFKHINECKYKNTQYECHVDKYNFLDKQFEKCLYTANNKDIENHFKKCAFLQYKCLFCNENILAINLKEHTEKKCKIRIINIENRIKYIGEYKNDKKDGYGKFYLDNNMIYEGEWKNDKKDGYGIFNLNNLLYEGEWKNDKKEGYGIMHYQNDIIYKGEWKNDEIEGYGIFDLKEIKCEGKWKKNKLFGYGIITLLDGAYYAGEFINNIREGYGMLYSTEGIIYKGEWKKNCREGYGILYEKNIVVYKGGWKNNKREGYGVEYHLTGRYEGGWKKNLRDGFGTEYNSDGCVEGRFENGKIKYVLSSSKYYSSIKSI